MSITAGIASGVASGVASSTAATVQEAFSVLIFGSFNPKYKKVDQRRMRYIQAKYASAYGNGSLDDYNDIIKSVDPNSRLKMSADGMKPENPFPSEKAFEDSLELSFYPVPGHQGKFYASHSLKCQGKITEYQLRRRKRPWIPKVSSPGRPNDYINLFLDELKTWLRNELTLDAVSADELKKREAYFAKLKHDNFHWCFPIESEDCNIQEVIDFVHDNVVDALEIVEREDKNKSLQAMFKELNDNLINSFEFGKAYLAYLLSASRKAGADLLSCNYFDGESIEKGKLHHLLSSATDPVMKSYVADIRDSEERVNRGAIGYPGAAMLATNGDESKSIDERQLGAAVLHGYEVDVPLYEESFASATVYTISISDPSKLKWVILRTFSELKSLHALIGNEYEMAHCGALPFPAKMTTIIATSQQQEERCLEIKRYLLAALSGLGHVSPEVRKTLAKFLETKELSVPNIGLVMAENIPNRFLQMRDEMRALMARESTPSTSGRVRESGDRRDLTSLRSTWGHDYVLKIFDAYALLQRLSTMLSWTLELNHFFVSMFGNTIAFSRLPLKEILLTLRDILGSLVALGQDLFKYACRLNANSQYKWHKNLELAESQLQLLRHHSEKSVALITRIETEHLDYSLQLRRLQDVASRFQPFMSRVGTSLPQIREELGLHSLPATLPTDTMSSFPNPSNFGNPHQPAALLLENNPITEIPAEAEAKDGVAILIRQDKSEHQRDGKIGPCDEEDEEEDEEKYEINGNAVQSAVCMIS